MSVRKWTAYNSPGISVNVCVKFETDWILVGVIKKIIPQFVLCYRRAAKTIRAESDAT